MVSSFRKYSPMNAPLYSVHPTLQQASAEPHLCHELLDCSFLLGPGVQKVCLFPPRVCFPVLCKFWCLYDGVNGNLLQEGLCHTQVCCTQSPCPCSRPLLTHASVGDSWTSGKSGSVSCGIISPFSWVPVHTRFCLCPPRICFPVLCKFWWLYGGVNGDLLQKGLCHTQVCCTQSPCPCGSPLLTHTSSGDTQT